MLVMLVDPAIRDEVARAFEADSAEADTKEAASAIANLEGVWNELFPVEQVRIVRMLVQRADGDLPQQGDHGLVQGASRRP